uniref:RING-type domain-containing protein n=1 Tax=Plectus sambesii TaxID=2011161 RepID=A0A914XJ41_9BILA
MAAPQCPVCFEQYDQKVLVPKQFTCGHSLCAVCAAQVQAEGTSLGVFGNMLKCPTCRSVSTYQKELSTNYALLAVSNETNDPEVIERAQAAALRVATIKPAAKNNNIMLPAPSLLTEVKVFTKMVLGWFAVIVAIHCALLAIWNVIYGAVYVVVIVAYSIVYYGVYCSLYGLVENLLSWFVFFFYTYALASIGLVMILVGLARFIRYRGLGNSVNSH